MSAKAWSAIHGKLFMLRSVRVWAYGIIPKLIVRVLRDVYRPGESEHYVSEPIETEYLKFWLLILLGSSGI